MKKVYLVVGHQDYAPSDIVGVYTTHNKAEKAMSIIESTRFSTDNNEYGVEVYDVE